MEKSSEMLLGLGILGIIWSLYVSSFNALSWAGALILGILGILGGWYIWKEHSPLDMLSNGFIMHGIASLTISLAFFLNGIASLAPLAGMTFATSWVIGGIAVSTALLSGLGLTAIIAPDVLDQFIKVR